MLQLHKLSITPELFKPVFFHPGVNLVVGERSEKSGDGKKVNGVGKSLFIEFLHFSLLRAYDKTRVSKVPEGVLSMDSVVELDCSIGNERIRILRRLNTPEQPTIITSEGSTEFEKVADATHFLGELLNQKHPYAGQVSFRQLLSLLMRDEDSAFQDYLNPHSKAGVGTDLERHLYLMGINGSHYSSIRGLYKEITTVTNRISDLKKQLERDTNQKLNDIPLYLNEQGGENKKIQEALEHLKADPAFENVEEDLVRIEGELHALRVRRKALSYQIQQIEDIPLPETIDATDMHIIYDRVFKGLGDIVSKSLDQVNAFKQKVEAFQSELRNEESVRLKKEKEGLQHSIQAYSDQHAENSRSLESKEVLSEIKNGVTAAMEKMEQYHKVKSLYNQHKENSDLREELKAQKEVLHQELRRELTQYAETVESLQETLINFHTIIQGSQGVSFSLAAQQKKTSKVPIEINYRINDDGSYGVNKTKTFLYDFSLMLSPATQPFHPQFLLHDNILEVDQDAMTKILNFLHDVTEENSFQYILTLNRDRIEPLENDKEVRLDIDKHKVLTLTKQKQFLGVRYKEK